MPACATCGHELTPDAKFCANCGSPVAAVAPARETRKTVTVLFADVTGSTALGEQLDPESLRALMTRYFAEMQAIIERHGGTVEKFIGDAVMAVFGIPAVHEDDALRAVRAAADIRDRLAELNAELTASRGIAIRFRTGVNTGEVVAGYPAMADSFVTGDTVNTAARLEQNAPPGEVLLGAPTYRLVRDAVEVEPVEPIAAKGKAAPVQAFRLVSVRPDAAGHARHLERPLVGRGRELGLLRAEFDQAVGERSARLVTVLGTAGVGKSRLVAELIESVRAEATVLKGRCLPYGEGITYWPIRELVAAAAGITEADTAETARASIRAVLAGEPEAELLARRVAAAIGLETEPAPQEELFWAIRKLLEHLARQRPTVLVIEDIHWAEPTLLDLLEYIVDLAADAPLLLVCPARPELLESRPGWAGRSATSLLRLEPLGADATEQLIDETPGGSALPAGLRGRILAAAEGNPLFVEELLAMLVDDGQLVEADGTWHAAADLDALAIPLSIKALLAARIDGLPEAERHVAERASVVGRTFEAAAVRELAGDGPTDVGRNLLALVRKELIRPDRSELVAGDAFKFRHILIRDAAYEALPKAERAVLHERFADWLVRVTGDRAAEYDEITGHHYAEAYRYRTELGDTGENVERLAKRAAERLLAAGKRAAERGDMSSARELLQRADRLSLDAAHLRGAILVELANVLYLRGELDPAISTSDEALRVSAVASDPAIAARARSTRLSAEIGSGRLINTDSAAGEEADLAIKDAEASGDPQALMLAYVARAGIDYENGQSKESSRLNRMAVEYARIAGNRFDEMNLNSELLVEALVGPARAPSVVEQGSELIRRSGDFPSIRARALSLTAIAEAMVGRTDEALEHADEAVSLLEKLGTPEPLMNARADRALVHMLVNDPAPAEKELRGVIADADAIGNRTIAAWAAGRLLPILTDGGRLDEAEQMADRAGDVAVVGNRMRALGALARIAAARGDPTAGSLVRRLVEALASVTFSMTRIDGLVDAAVASRTMHNTPAAVMYVTEALRMADAKGNVARAAQLRSLIGTFAETEVDLNPS